MRTEKIVIGTSDNGMMALAADNLSSAQCYEISLILTYNTYEHEYKLRTDSGAFLKGYDEKGGKVLVEFWNPINAQAFVDYVNDRLELI